MSKQSENRLVEMNEYFHVSFLPISIELIYNVEVDEQGGKSGLTQCFFT